MMDSQEQALQQGKAEEQSVQPIPQTESKVNEQAQAAADKQQPVMSETENQANDMPAEQPTAIDDGKAETADSSAQPAETTEPQPNAVKDSTTETESTTATEPAQGLKESETDEPTAESTKPAEPQKPVLKAYKTKAEIIARLKDIVSKGENPSKDELEHLKTSFYKLHIAEREASQKEYLAKGGNPDEYQVLPDEEEETFKAEMGVIKERRAKIQQQAEAEKEANLKRKLDIIEKIKGMATSPEQANKSFAEFKALQQEWKDIKAVPPEKSNELWRNYQLYVEQFYDLLNLNREAREYDFKKNLEAKTRICETAEKLAEEPDVISAFHQLQELHQQFREIGPVAKELREPIWARFKAASTVINKRHQQHFTEIRAKEDENLAKKTALCEQVEAIAKEENKGAADWEKHAKQIIALQTEWKSIGFAPQKMNVKIFERFRAACDDFFGRKAQFFKDMKEHFAENAAKKKELVAKAKELSESKDWKATADKLIALQKEWKTIGVVPKKLGDQLWHEFLGACNHFFETRNAANAGVRNEERDNLKKKRNVIARLKELAANATDGIEEKVQQLADEYNSIGHVPFKDKDKVYKEYHDVLDKLYENLHISVARHKLDNYKNTIKEVARRGEDALDSERGRLLRRYDQLRAEANTYENNLGFLNISSKKGNSLIDEMKRKVQKLRDEAELVKQKIKAIDQQSKEQSEETPDKGSEK